MAKMHQTTIRFSDDLWALLEREAAGSGVSAAQFIRDAALGRIAYNAGRRGDPYFESIVELSTRERREFADEVRSDAEQDPARHDTTGDSEAVWAQGRLVRERARALREDSRRMRSNQTR